MKVTLIDHLGTDLTIVNAARVSFAKESAWEDDISKMNTGEDSNGKYFEHTLKNSDKKLIQYLATHGHFSPFAHPQIQLHFKVPIFVARQLFKHTVGFTYNEVSRRYVDSEPEFYTPENWRKKNPDKKQGSLDEVVNVLCPYTGEELQDLWGDVDNKGHPTLHVQYAMDILKDTYKELS